MAGGGSEYTALGGITSFSSLVDGIDRIPFEATALESSSSKIGNNSSSIKACAIEIDGGLMQIDDMIMRISFGECDSHAAKQGKMTMDQEFAIYETKYKKQSGSKATITKPFASITGNVSAIAPLNRGKITKSNDHSTDTKSDIDSKVLCQEPARTNEISSSLQLLKQRMKSATPKYKR